MTGGDGIAETTSSARVTGRVDVTATPESENSGLAARMTFHPGARTDWHTYPAGQTLLVIEGLGRAQRGDGAIEPMQPGDAIWFEPGERRWFGASPEHSIALLVLAESGSDDDVVWLESVDDADYHAN
ncbi:hypothetical protein ASE63_25460 [Bosea sp. Root381]|uniref:cupin domain-containing protein n=1 Tax=Bosea sp. Root381 TaxID=1736524 RepID=UPI0006F40CA6|nr:cupin domain-containing protein [Bosea sp. Root381]KRE04370.1 hypothetical protein ASE63_25460 [Bosea sp. Root381]